MQCSLVVGTSWHVANDPLEMNFQISVLVLLEHVVCNGARIVALLMLICLFLHFLQDADHKLLIQEYCQCNPIDKVWCPIDSAQKVISNLKRMELFFVLAEFPHCLHISSFHGLFFQSANTLPLSAELNIGGRN